MLAFGWKRIEAPPRNSFSGQKLPHIPNFWPQKRVTLVPPRVCDLPQMWGRAQTKLIAQWLRYYDKRKGQEALMWKITTRGFTLRKF